MLFRSEKKVYAEFLLNAQGEDVVAGVRTPEKIEWLEKNMPEVYKQFEETITKMEAYFKDMQDMEYTVEKGTLYFLQTRNGKRTAAAALKIACDLVDEGLIDEKTAVLRVDPMQLNDLLHPTFNPADLKKHTPIFHGLPASPGAGTGHLVFTADEAKAAKRNHDFWFDIVAKFLACFNSSLDDGFGKHSIDFWIGNAKSDTTEAHHWVGLVKLVDSIFDLLFADVKSSG